MLVLVIIVLINFNPRSLAGATLNHEEFWVIALFQSTLPRGSDW